MNLGRRREMAWVGAKTERAQRSRKSQTMGSIQKRKRVEQGKVVFVYMVSGGHVSLTDGPDF